MGWYLILHVSTVIDIFKPIHIMTTEDLSSAFFALNERVERTEGHGANLYECVDFNANLLTEVCKELALLRSA